MKLASVYIKTHDYLFNEPQTINFGGQYIYEYIHKNKRIEIHTVENKTYIEDFFNITDSKSKVTGINAIVGQNGSGKSSIMDTLRNTFKFYQPRNHNENIILIFEIEKNTILVIKHETTKIKLKSKAISTTNEINISDIMDIQTLYYNPHYEYNLTKIDDYDISLNAIIENDLNSLKNKDSNSSGFENSYSNELLFKNSLRQIEFLSSELVIKKQIFKKIFQLPEHGNAILEIRTQIVKDSWNAPYDLRDIIENIIIKCKEEKALDYKENNIRDRYKYVLKTRLIEALISTISNQMEKKNSYLGEGKINKLYKDTLNSMNAYQLMSYFINNAYIEENKKKISIFKDCPILELIDNLYLTIQNISSKDELSPDSFQINANKAKEILTLQRQVLNKINNYYLIDPSDSEINNYIVMDEFISYRPFEKRLSSGENALLNLYSRLANFINHNYINHQLKPLKKHFILLLDEGDLGFHPSWKKKYVNLILKTVPYFFEQIKNAPSIEIIFATHDPLTLSDLPNKNVVYIERKDYDSYSNVLHFSNENRPKKTFGANISELLADSFFIDGALIGDFASSIVEDTINWLNGEDDNNSDYYEKIINMIDEPIVKLKLAEMFDNKMNKNTQINLIDKQIKELTALRNKLLN